MNIINSYHEFAFKYMYIEFRFNKNIINSYHEFVFNHEFAFNYIYIYIYRPFVLKSQDNKMII